MYIGTNSDGEIIYDSIILQVNNICSSIESSYTWTNLTQSEYEFSVIAYTSKGPGKAASLMISTLPKYGKLIIILTLNYIAMSQAILKIQMLQELIIIFNVLTLKYVKLRIT